MSEIERKWLVDRDKCPGLVSHRTSIFRTIQGYLNSDWVYSQQGGDKIKEKEKAVISNNYKYILIINKNYSNFKNLLK
jgi:hypothetical protein